MKWRHAKWRERCTKVSPTRSTAQPCPVRLSCRSAPWPCGPQTTLRPQCGGNPNTLHDMCTPRAGASASPERPIIVVPLVRPQHLRSGNRPLPCLTNTRLAPTAGRGLDNDDNPETKDIQTMEIYVTAPWRNHYNEIYKNIYEKARGQAQMQPSTNPACWDGWRRSRQRSQLFTATLHSSRTDHIAHDRNRTHRSA